MSTAAAHETPRNPWTIVSGPAPETLLCNDPSPGCWGTEEPVRRGEENRRSRLPSGRTRELGARVSDATKHWRARAIANPIRKGSSRPAWRSFTRDLGAVAVWVASVRLSSDRIVRHLCQKKVPLPGLGGGGRGTNGDTVKSCVSPPTAATPVCAGRPRRSSACAARGRRRGCRPAAKRPRARLPLSPHPGARARRRLCARTPTQTDRSIGKGGEAGGHRQGTLTSSQQAGLSLSPTLTLPLNRRGRP